MTLLQLGLRFTVYDVIYFNRDTIKLNEPIRGYVELRSKPSKEYPIRLRAFIARQEKNYNYDFSNEKKVELDTFYDLSIDTINKKWFKGVEPESLVVIGQYFDSIGDKTIRGYYQQYSYGPFKKMENGNKIDSVIGYKTYFEKKIYVKDSLE
ncbi:hypothetical protein ACFO5O_08855 [Geojedonia litorea]|uniref:Uncharacterized protein n=1 Tax=Geojedonia litorea TaxID=1268269 RepID=A0ABV9N4E1_9FLAO